MTNNLLNLVLLIGLLTVSSLTSCGGSNNNKNEAIPTNNACNDIGLLPRIISPRIIAGTECKESSSPIVKIFISSSSLCSGTLISKRHVLTAAHCAVDTTTKITFSPSSFLVQDSTGLRPPIVANNITVHPEFFIDRENQIINNDVAIVELQSELNMPTLPLLLSKQLEQGEIISIFGYGISENQEIGVLKSGEMKVAKVNGDRFSSNFNDVGSNTCFGDSGGPALSNAVNGEIGIVGLTSSGINDKCTSEDTSFFTAIAGSTIAQFILNIVPNAKII
jgi:secreted trypsin-like serine protease